MRYGIFSDIHSNLEALERVIEAYRKEDIDQYLCAGDIVGYAANPNECIRKINMLQPLVTIAGNHDWASVSLFSDEYFNDYAKEAVRWTRDNLETDSRYFLQGLKLTFNNDGLIVVHGTLNNPEDFDYLTDTYIAEATFRTMNTPLCFIGHTHFPGVFIREDSGEIGYNTDATVNIEPDKKYIVNVGSVGQPRDHNPKASYCIFDADKKEVSIKRVDYDKEGARKKIISAGLPRFLGDRLLTGR